MGLLKDKLVAALGQSRLQRPDAHQGANYSVTSTKNKTTKPGPIRVMYGKSNTTKQRGRNTRVNGPSGNYTGNCVGNHSTSQACDKTKPPGRRSNAVAARSAKTNAALRRQTQQRPNPIRPGSPTVTELLKKTPQPSASLTVHGAPEYRFQHDLPHVDRLTDLPIEIGLKTQIHSNVLHNPHDVTLGFDFGTSAVKVVVGDATIEKYFAVPFRVGSGIDQYLLPCRLWENRDTLGLKFSLNEGESAYRDLKLSLLADPTEESHKIRSIAFFALVFQRVRAWLFTEHKEIYSAADIVWSVAIGLPSESHVDNNLTPLFARLVSLAWRLSAEREIRPTTIESILRTENEPQEDIPVSVIPEIAAQIFGFVSSPSSRFDRNRANRYAIVDIGAGTVDSSVFEVKNTEGLWNFTYYTAVVEPNGAANLHAHRIDWWVDALKPFDTAHQVRESLLSQKYSTDTETPIPASYADYVSNVTIDTSNNDTADPDAAFFRFRLLRQIRGSTVLRCWKNNLLEQTQIEGMPIFVCGGGARMDFYANLIEALPRTPGANWLTLDPWPLKRPSDLICRNVPDTDYDRLSVAYGLSRIHLGKIDTALPLPTIPNPAVATWRDRYVDKDQV